MIIPAGTMTSNVTSKEVLSSKTLASSDLQVVIFFMKAYSRLGLVWLELEAN